jgi:hypothetical protein
VTHYLDQFAQLLEDTYLDYTKYCAALMLQNIILLIESMIYGMNCLPLLLTLESVAVFKKRLRSVDISARLRYPCFISV